VRIALLRVAVTTFLLGTALIPAAVCAQSFTISTDFGSGTFNKFHSSGSSRPEGPRARSRDDSYQQYLVQRYVQQQRDAEREAQRRAEEERLRRELAAAKARQDVREIEDILNVLDRLESDEPDPVKRLEYTTQILALMKEFEAARARYVHAMPDYRSRMAASLDTIHVPPARSHFHRILIWGATRTPEEADSATKTHEVDPFTGSPYDRVFAFGTPGLRDVFGRAALDHFLKEFRRLSATTASQLEALHGRADEVVCHSNGCAIAEVLIGNGWLQTKSLHVLGGDNALLDLEHLQDLSLRRRVDVDVFAIKGDPVPLIPTAWQIMDKVALLGKPLQTYARMTNDLSYQLLGVVRQPPANVNAGLQVHILSYPYVLNPLRKHDYPNYSRIVKGLRLTGCLTQRGSLSQRCLLY
jgi:hypothetical protein